jgi:hypothetical protein
LKIPLSAEQKKGAKIGINEIKNPQNAERKSKK